ncbi:MULTISPECIES: DUF3221 domain-containing protein [Bacillus]|uniref:DUF3221 domain-containing protein n=1 Tax=Bacillus TaxID=1386 RepID=UPI000993984D|nr:DUF3221 domain-containing protein [Bacillus pseudomycoides]MED1599631.1 DUF3221 domain-containing protein [Bacillus pseudomycoides]MED4714747.1 DUF3221 domain-containing protein [Bacillus pseudomycoides]OOR48403.1 DUF3221 domain-containing protein [Bacillus pseudomycoides]PDY09320.1 DUF3221 domain-containing protein [Bacillus pseudomycoides]PEU23899.1 DUF3221 domain-containing protein [Bacillus pseudomycoides]
MFNKPSYHALILILLAILLLSACNKSMVNNKSEGKDTFTFQGKIVKLDKEHKRILIYTEDYGKVWVRIPKNDEIQNYGLDQEVGVWIEGGIEESSPAKAKASCIEKIGKLLLPKTSSE